MTITKVIVQIYYTINKICKILKVVRKNYVG